MCAYALFRQLVVPGVAVCKTTASDLTCDNNPTPLVDMLCVWLNDDVSVTALVLD